MPAPFTGATAPCFSQPASLPLPGTGNNHTRQSAALAIIQLYYNFFGATGKRHDRWLLLTGALCSSPTESLAIAINYVCIANTYVYTATTYVCIATLHIYTGSIEPCTATTYVCTAFTNVYIAFINNYTATTYCCIAITLIYTAITLYCIGIT